VVGLIEAAQVPPLRFLGDLLAHLLPTSEPGMHRADQANFTPEQ
jgi:hypothetical protein